MVQIQTDVHPTPKAYPKGDHDQPLILLINLPRLKSYRVPLC